MDRPQALDTIIEFERKRRKMEDIIIDSERKGQLQIDYASLFI